MASASKRSLAAGAPNAETGDAKRQRADDLAALERLLERQDDEDVFCERVKAAVKKRHLAAAQRYVKAVARDQVRRAAAADEMLAEFANDPDRLVEDEPHFAYRAYEAWRGAVAALNGVQALAAPSVVDVDAVVARAIEAERLLKNDNRTALTKLSHTLDCIDDKLEDLVNAVDAAAKAAARD